MTTSKADGNIVAEWLRSLHLGQYAESFIDNGYDDLEICKQVGEPDLDAIGVLNPAHRQRVLTSVRIMREEGAANVYFTLEEASQSNVCRCEAEVSPRMFKDMPSCSRDSVDYLDEYEEGKAELVRLPRSQLRRLLREKLSREGIRLSLQPYSTADGDRGYLDGLSSRYADQLKTHYGDVLETLDELRRLEWEEMSPRMRVLSTNLTTSLSQPIYVPGKYSPSSCLSDREEDEIYGFGYGVYGNKMMKRHHQQRQLVIQMQNSPTANQPLIHEQRQNYQSCNSQRSAYFYEFPPGDNSTCKAKKGTTFSRLIKSLKTRKEKNGCSDSPKNSSRMQANIQKEDASSCSALDSRDHARMAGLRLQDLPSHTMHRFRLDELKMNQLDSQNDEKIHDMRRGTIGLRRAYSRGRLGDDTHLYDEDDARMMGRGHWYDEPPYESDPDDFLMQTRTPIAYYHNGRVCFINNIKDQKRRQNVITLGSAGDISLLRHQYVKHESINEHKEAHSPLGPTSRPSPSSPDSSDYEDRDDFETESMHVATVHKSAEECDEISNLVGKVRGLRQDVRQKICRLRAEQTSDVVNNTNERVFPCPASSFESLPSGSGSSTQALVRAGSNHSSISTEEITEHLRQPYAHTLQQRDIGRLVREYGGSVENILRALGLQQYTSILARGGYLRPELFREIEPRDLDYLGISRPDHRAAMMTVLAHYQDLPLDTGFPRRGITVNPVSNIPATNVIGNTGLLHRALEAACSEKSSDSGISSSSLSSRRLDAAS